MKLLLHLTFSILDERGNLCDCASFRGLDLRTATLVSVAIACHLIRLSDLIL